MSNYNKKDKFLIILDKTNIKLNKKRVKSSTKLKLFDEVIIYKINYKFNNKNLLKCKVRRLIKKRPLRGSIPSALRYWSSVTQCFENNYLKTTCRNRKHSIFHFAVQSCTAIPILTTFGI